MTTATALNRPATDAPALNQPLCGVDATHRGWSYEEAFCRNLGLIDQEDQQKLRNSRVAIAGMGGVGGIHLITLARLGIGKFTIADGDVFELANMNRQYGCRIDTLGQAKVDVMADEARRINPTVDIRAYRGPLERHTVGEFLEDADVFVDAVDLFAMDVRRLLFRFARARRIHAVTAAPIACSVAWLIFGPDGPTFDRYFDISDTMSDVDKLIAFAIGLAPKATHASYLDLSRVDLRQRIGPSICSACQLAAGIVASEVTKILLCRKPVWVAPFYQQFDPYVGRFVRGKLARGNRSLRQRLRRWWLRHRYLPRFMSTT